MIYAIGAFLAGAILVVQAGLNGGMRVRVGSPVWAAIVSFGVGLAALLIVAAARREEAPTLAALRQMPPYLYIGGLLGAVYVGSAIVLLPRLGALAMFGLVVAGQMAASLLIDHFGLLGAERSPVSATRLASAALVLVAVWLARK